MKSGGKNKLWLGGIMIGIIMVLFAILAKVFNWAGERWFFILMCILLIAFLYLRVANRVSEERKKRK